MLTGKKVVLGITGSIAAYKMANVASMLVKLNCDVHVIMTKNATQFITPVTFETITKNPCHLDTFERNTPIEVHHIVLGQKSDLILVAPASADVMGKMANGIADDMLTSTIVAANCPILVAPAMNTVMYQNPIVQANKKRLESFGFSFIEPAVGHLACDVTGIGKLPEEQVLVDAVVQRLCNDNCVHMEENGQNIKKCNRLLDNSGKGLKVLITAGPTRESLDPVRYLTNHSTGKMGYALAEEAAARGASVTLISGPVNLKAAEGIRVLSVITADEMYQTLMQECEEQDIVIKAAAVADYRPKESHLQKIKKDGELTLALERTKDILYELGKRKKETQCICGFCMETEHVMENARVKLEKKNADIIAANCLREEGAGFGCDTNHLVLFDRQGEIDLGMRTKHECANELLDHVYEMWKKKQNKTGGEL